MATHADPRDLDSLEQLLAVGPTRAERGLHYRLVASVDGRAHVCGESTFATFRAAQAAVARIVPELPQPERVTSIELQSSNLASDVWHTRRMWDADVIQRILWQHRVARSLADMLNRRSASLARDDSADGAPPAERSSPAPAEPASAAAPRRPGADEAGREAPAPPPPESAAAAHVLVAAATFTAVHIDPVPASPDDKVNHAADARHTAVARQIPVMPALDADEIGLATELARPGLLPLVPEIAFGDSRLDVAPSHSDEIAAAWDAVARGMVAPPPLPTHDMPPAWTPPPARIADAAEPPLIAEALPIERASDGPSSAEVASVATHAAVEPRPPMTTADAFEQWSRYERIARREVAFDADAATSADSADHAPAAPSRGSSDDWTYPLAPDESRPADQPLWPAAATRAAAEPSDHAAQALAASVAVVAAPTRRASSHDSYAAERVDLSDDSVAGMIVRGVDSHGRPTRVMTQPAREIVRHPGSASWILPFTVGFAAVSLIVFVLALADGSGWRMGDKPPVQPDEVRKTLPWDAATFPGEVDARRESGRPATRPAGPIIAN